MKSWVLRSGNEATKLMQGFTSYMSGEGLRNQGRDDHIGGQPLPVHPESLSGDPEVPVFLLPG